MKIDLAASGMNAPWTRSAALLLAVLAVLGCTALALMFAGQPLLDRHDFRQTQTAISAYWFLQDGFRFAYEVPVTGYPWILPFEFPIYQAIVAGFARVTGLSLSMVGRLVSFGFLLLCIPAVASINRRLKLPSTVLVMFVALTFTTPVYVYWGRAFLIETAALFFGLMAIKYALDILLGGQGLLQLVCFASFMSLCLLQKVTTGLPILMVFAVLFAIGEVRRAPYCLRASVLRMATLGTAVLVPLVIAYAWTCFTDAAKQASPLGPALTSSALAKWTWGTAEQRLSSGLWQSVILTRVLFLNLGRLMGAGFILFALVVGAERHPKVIILTTTVLGILPLFLFTNLHIVHDYYQSANVMFLTFGLAVALGAVIVPRTGSFFGLVFLTALMAANCVAFVQSGYLAAMAQAFDARSRPVAVARVLARELPQDGQFVAFGNGYSPTFAFLSGRKSFMVPDWYKDFDKVVAHPDSYVEDGHLGAVVACSEKPDFAQVLDWAAAQGGWTVGETAGCTIAIPPAALPSAPRPGACRGEIEQAGIANRAKRKVISVSGWSALAGSSARAPDALFIGLRNADHSRIVPALRVPRPDISQSLGAGDDMDFGFSRLLAADLASGIYSVSLIQRVDGRYITCQTSSTFIIP